MKQTFCLVFVLIFVWPAYCVMAQIQWEPHPVELSEELAERVRFGYLAVPEHRANPDSREIFMAFTVLKSHAENPLPDPVIVLPGGPGIGLSQFVSGIAGNAVVQKILQKRDVILIDIRGSGYSHPRLCDNKNTEEYRLRSAFSQGAERDLLHENVFAECAEKIRLAGAEITAYNSVEAAHDLEALRLALGYEQWNIRGGSYGTRHGMTLIQQYPQTVRSAVFSTMSVLGNYHDRTPVYLARSLRILFEYCKNDEECNEAYPALESDLSRLLQRLEKDPIPLPSFAREKIGDENYHITPEILLGGLFNLLYHKIGIEMTPLLIHQLAEGNDWIAQNMALAIANEFSSSSRDLFFIMWNNDNEPDPTFLAPGTRDELAERLFQHMPGMTEEGLHEHWLRLRGSNQAAREVWGPSDIPVLLISGELDPITPPAHGDVFAAFFPNHSHHVIPGSGHYPHADARIDFSSFYDDPDPGFDIHSHMEVQPLRFVTGVSLNRGISKTFALIGSGMYQSFILPGVALLFCLFGLLYFPLRNLARRIRKKPREGLFGVTFSVWMACFLSVAVTVLFYLAVRDALATNPYILGAGLPSQWGFITWIIVALMMFLLAGMVNARKVWPGSAWVKIPSIISLAGGLLFVVYIVGNGLI